MSFKVIDPGAMALIQDGGRKGFQHLGVTAGGPMDEYAFDWANWLLGNTRGAAALEITYGLVALEAQADVTIALTGADLGASLNGKPLLPWQACQVSAGDRLSFATPVSGLRAYIAMPGGIKAEPRLGSVATVVREKVGGLDGSGQSLKKGDILQSTSPRPNALRHMPDWAVPDYGAPLLLGVIPGYQFEGFSTVQRMKFFSSDYMVTSNIDRMGYRLKGEAVISEQSGIISEGIALGAIQIPQDGQPIVLMRDRQTIGGYPKIGCVFSLDLAKLSQRKPGDGVAFTLMDVADAENRRALYDHQFRL